MPLPIIPVSPFPNVPQLPGVPQLVRSLLFPPTPAPQLGQTASTALWVASQHLPVWGVFDSAGIQVLNPDNIIAFDNRNEWRIPDYPIQAGSFASYNKVIIPSENSLRFTKGGSQADRASFLRQIADIAGDLNLYTIRTPEVTYASVNVMRYEVTRRGSGGAYYLTEVDVYFRQINQVAAQYSTTTTANAQNPAAKPAVNQGQVQPQTNVPAAVVAAAQTIIANPLK